MDERSAQQPGLKELTVRGRWSAADTEAVLRGEVESLLLNQGLGFDDPTLAFLSGLPVKKISIIDRRVRDLTIVESLSDSLVSLKLVTDPSGRVNLGELPNLRELSADWKQVEDSFGEASMLRRVYLGRFSESSLNVFFAMRQLSELSLKDRPKIESLQGLPSGALRSLTVAGAKKLRDVNALEGALGLEYLDLEGCPGISDLDFVSAFLRLMHLNVSECGVLASLAPLAGLTGLTSLYLYGSTRVEDGDLSVLTELPALRSLRMQSRRHYVPSVRQIQELISGAK